MGIGVTLYFRLVVRPASDAPRVKEPAHADFPAPARPQKYLAWITFFMSLLSIPPILFNVHGTRITSEERDPLLLSLTTAGNLGSDGEDTQFINATTKDLFQCSALLCACTQSSLPWSALPSAGRPLTPPHTHTPGNPLQRPAMPPTRRPC